MNPNEYTVAGSSSTSLPKEGGKDKGRKKQKKLQKALDRALKSKKGARKKAKKWKHEAEVLKVTLDAKEAISEERLRRCKAETALEVLARVYANGNAKFPSLREINDTIVKETDCDD